MQAKSVVRTLLVVCLAAGVATPLLAQEAMRVSPTILQPGDESFLTLHVQGVADTDIVTIAFNGPAGVINLEPVSVSAEAIVAWVPVAIMIVEGRYSVDVYVVRGTETIHYGPGFFDVAPLPPDPNPPLLLTLPESVFAEAADANGNIVTYYVASNDGTPVNCTPPAGSVFPLGVTTVNCTATDGTRTAQGSFTVFVLDVVPPVLTVPDDIVSDVPVVQFAPSATDAIDPTPTVFCSPQSGATFPRGVTLVECFAFDQHHNFAFGSFTVTVSGGVPVLTVPANITVEATSPQGTVVTFTPTATENATITCNPPSGSTFPIGATSVNCTATNAAGSDTEVFQVRVRDTVAPVIITVNATPDVLWPPNHEMVQVTLNAVVLDVADLSPTTSIIAVSSSQPVNAPGDGNTSPDWEITGPMTVNLRAERAGNTDRIYTITIQSTDDSGNSSTATTFVRVTQSRRRGR